MIEYKFKESNFDGRVIKDIIRFVNAFQNKYSNVKLPIHFNLGNIEIKDKLTYILFECVCNYLVETCNTKVMVTFNAKDTIYIFEKSIIRGFFDI